MQQKAAHTVLQATKAGAKTKPYLPIPTILLTPACELLSTFITGVRLFPTCMPLNVSLDSRSCAKDLLAEVASQLLIGRMLGLHVLAELG